MTVQSPSRPISTNLALHRAAERLVRAKEHDILLVEDTAAHAALVRRAIDSSVWEIEHVTRASDALRAFEKNPERIVLLDLSLPDSDGMQLLGRLKGIYAEAAIIVVTATDHVRVSVEAMQKGAWDYVVKEGDPKKMGQRLIAALENAWNKRMSLVESQLIEQSRISELLRSERLCAIESIIQTVCAEVNNPLSGVVALSQLLKKHENLDEELQRLADGILRSASQVADVVEKLKSLNDTSPQPRESSLSKDNTANDSDTSS
jgi:FixJ family two-component response regulator